MYISKKKHERANVGTDAVFDAVRKIVCPLDDELCDDAVKMPDEDLSVKVQSVNEEASINDETEQTGKETFFADGKEKNSEDIPTGEEFYTEKVEPETENMVEKNPQVLGDAGQSVTLSDFLRDNTDTGVLRIQASGAENSFPLPFVNITVYRDFADGRHEFFFGVTDGSGVIDGIILPAPVRSESLSPDLPHPFASYSVLASKQGMGEERIVNVPIFSGVKSIQPITLENI